MEDKAAYIRGMVRRRFRGRMVRELWLPMLTLLVWGAGCVLALIDEEFTRHFGPFYHWFGRLGAKLGTFALYLLLFGLSVGWLWDSYRRVRRQAHQYENQLRQEAGLERLQPNE